MRRRLAPIAACVLAACAAPLARGGRVEFFPGPVDERLQVAAYDAVAGVLQLRGARIVDAYRPFGLRAQLPLECAGQRRLATVRFTRSSGPQSVSVRVCRVESALEPCGDDAPEDRLITECGQAAGALLSTIEADLADHLLTWINPERYETRRWWDDAWPWSLLSVISLRSWIVRDDGDRWGASRSASLAAGPAPAPAPWADRRSAALVRSSGTGALESTADAITPRAASSRRSGSFAR